MIRAVLCDLSGVLYQGETAFEGALDALLSFQAAGIPVKYITNTTRNPRRVLMNRLLGMGFRLGEKDLFTPATAALSHLRAHGLSPHLLVHPRLEPEFADLPSGEPNAVLVGDAGEGFSYGSLNAAFRLVMEGAPLLALGVNRYFREDGGLSLDAGPFVRALEYAASVQALVLGKPSADFFRTAIADFGVPPEQVVMIGDDYESDVEGAMAAGLKGILVRTGKYRDGDEDRISRPGAAVCDDIGSAVDLIL